MDNFETLRDDAIALRRAGRSRREIKEQLGVTSNRDLSRLLDGVAPAESTKRPNAKDALRERARVLRAEGWMYDEIVTELGVSKSSVSLWTRDVSTPALEWRIEQRKAEGEVRRQQGWEAWRAETRREGAIRRQQTKIAAAQEIGDLSKRDVLMLGALAYWCEGSKDKTYDRREQVDFINSDPGLIRLFLRFLGVAGVDYERIRFRVHIHETADLVEATRYWADVVGVEPARFQKPVIKRHSPKTNRKNLTGAYRGCLLVRVSQCVELYRQIEGWASGAMLGHVREQAKPIETPTAESQLAMVHELRARARQGSRSEEESV